ncbi:SAM-dependent methyltransferase [Niastella yeongjuensis]|uniref:SAM-dependent methyltransferase n=1 Tax=Niastella yeongjuensis TaxID=354355 RepID=A0A1V9F0J8_9BACT|nr:class I SAM-dependent methyltransferase [Niastella yeongjuensis]OQP51822.1 SAM-dependent methyltransferase [Niastella yeongjuensis]SEP44477.1 Methyltransferase domain-containing protein [Niastella yeongjuensis]
MYSSWQLLKKYSSYYVTALNGKGHGIHSPFVYDFVRCVLNDKRNFYAYDQVEALRQKLLHNEAMIEVEDFGAGSTISKTNQRSVAAIARHSAKSKKWAQLLFRIVNFYQPKNMLELGTSLGISTAYMSLANPKARVVTAEGSAAVAAQAQRNFQSLQLSSIQQVVGNFDDTLPDILNTMSPLDLVFIDGNHRHEPTLRYFNQILPHLNTTGVVIFDDIHWSPEMEQAWAAIKEHSAVQLSVDLFFVGLVFFNDQFKIKQHFTIRF